MQISTWVMAHVLRNRSMRNAKMRERKNQEYRTVVPDHPNESKLRLRRNWKWQQQNNGRTKYEKHAIDQNEENERRKEKTTEMKWRSVVDAIAFYFVLYWHWTNSCRNEREKKKKCSWMHTVMFLNVLTLWLSCKQKHNQ